MAATASRDTRAVTTAKHWMDGLLFGVLAVVASAFAFAGLIVVVAVGIWFSARRGGLASLSGLLTGFGGVWVLLVQRQDSSGGVLENASFWLAVGAVPLVAGLALLLLVAARGLPQRGVTRP